MRWRSSAKLRHYSRSITLSRVQLTSCPNLVHRVLSYRPCQAPRDVFSENPGNEVEVVLEMTNFGEIIERGKKSSWCVYVLFLTSLEEFHYKVVQWRQRNALKSVMHVQVRCKELFKPFFTVRIAVAVMISWLPIISLIVNHLCIVEFLHCWLVR